MIIAGNLELVDGIVLQLGKNLAHQVNEHERENIRPKGLEYLIARHRTGLNTVDDKRHDIGVGKRKQEDVARRRKHRKENDQRLCARDVPKSPQRSTHGRSLDRAGTSLRHGLPFADDGQWLLLHIGG